MALETQAVRLPARPASVTVTVTDTDGGTHVLPHAIHTEERDGMSIGIVASSYVTSGGGGGLSFVGVGVAASGTGDITPSLPSGLLTGDLLLMHIQCDDLDTVTPPSGWTAVEDGASSSLTRCAVLRRFHDGGGAPTLTDPGDHGLAFITAWRGADAVSPINASNITTGLGNTSTPRTHAGPSTSVDGCLVVSTWAIHENHSSVTTTADTVADYTRAAIADTTQGNDGTLVVDYGTLSTAGASGDFTISDWSGGGLRQHVPIVVAIAPAS